MTIDTAKNLSANIDNNAIFNAMSGKQINKDEGFLVLLVDDDRELSALMARALQQRGFRTLTASSGSMALSLIVHYVPDMIVLDVMMPGMTGHEVLHTIKTRPQFSQTPIIMMTSRTQQNDVVGAMGQGATAYLIKPVAPDVLADKMESLLMHHQDTMDDNDARVMQILEEAYRYGN